MGGIDSQDPTSFVWGLMWVLMWLGSAGWLLKKGRRGLGIWSIFLGWMAPIVPFIIACAAVDKVKLDARNMAVAYAAQIEREQQTALLKQVATYQVTQEAIPQARHAAAINAPEVVVEAEIIE